MTDWVLWLAAAGVLLLAELFTLTFVLGLMSAAAAIAALSALLGAPLVVEVGAFAVATGVLFILVRPFERMHQGAPALQSGVDALPGRTALVTEAISDHSGRVKLGGESWAARPMTPGSVLPVGTDVAVVKVDGATLVVYPKEM